MCSRTLVKPHVLSCEHAYCEGCLANLSRSTWPNSHCITCLVPFAWRDAKPSPVLQGVVTSFDTILARISAEHQAQLRAAQAPRTSAPAPAAAAPAAQSAPLLDESWVEELDDDGPGEPSSSDTQATQSYVNAPESKRPRLEV